MNTDQAAEPEGWRRRAAELQEQGGVPERRAEIVALREQGLTYSEIGDVLNDIAPSNISHHLDLYREQLAEAEWLAENAPDKPEEHL